MSKKYYYGGAFLFALATLLLLCLFVLFHGRAAEAEARLDALMGKREFTNTDVYSASAVAFLAGTVIEEEDASFMELFPGDNVPIPVKNRNPLNIKTLGKNDQWEGQIGKDRHGHAIFESVEAGIRAGAFVLSSYEKRHNITTINDLVKRFCTANRVPYAAFLGEKMGLDPDEEFALTSRLPELLRHMAHFETGRPWPEKYFLPYDVAVTLVADNETL